MVSQVLLLNEAEEWGLSLEPDDKGRLRVRELVPDSQAAQAGVMHDDVLVCYVSAAFESYVWIEVWIASGRVQEGRTFSRRKDVSRALQEGKFPIRFQFLRQQADGKDARVASSGEGERELVVNRWCAT
jgi:hypothetical protein